MNDASPSLDWLHESVLGMTGNWKEADKAVNEALQAKWAAQDDEVSHG